MLCFGGTAAVGSPTGHSLPAAVTPLRFKEPEPHSDGSRRRLGLREGWRVEGNLHTLGYFAGAPALVHLAAAAVG